MSELSPRASEILEAARRTSRAPSKEAIERMERALVVSTGVVAGAAGAKLASMWGSLGALGKGIVGAAALTVAGAAVTATVVATRETPPVIEVRREAPRPKPVAVRAETPPPVVEVSPEPVVVPPEPVPVPAPVVRKPAPPPVQKEEAASPPPLVVAPESEVALLRRAKLALESHDASAALTALDEHHVAYPGGGMSLEADVLRVLAWCELGKHDEASQLATRLRESAPRSPALRRLEGSCVE